MSKLKILVNSNAKMSRGKYAAQAVHAALEAFGVHPGCAVIVLGGTAAEIEACLVQIRDAGKTEVEPGTLTAGVLEMPEPAVEDARAEALKIAARGLLGKGNAHYEVWCSQDKDYGTPWDRGFAAGVVWAAHQVANSIDRPETINETVSKHPAP